MSLGGLRMSMMTELDLQQQVIIGGEKIAVFKWTLGNIHLHQFCCVLSRLQLAALECDSNNTSGGMIPFDAESLYNEWGRAKREYARGVKWSHLAPASQEKILSVLAITSNEELRTVNVKVRRLISAIGVLIHKAVYCDSAKLQFGIGAADQRKLQDQIDYSEEVLLDYIGDGVRSENGFNVGMEVPAFEHLGVVVPPINLHEAQVYEPSPASPDVPFPDVPDTASTVPVPGSSTSGAKK